MSDTGYGTQAKPVPNENPSAHDLVCADLEERKAHGLRKYDTLLQSFNGRQHLLDAYEEALDQAVYLKTALNEWDALMADPRVQDAYRALQTKSQDMGLS